MENGDFEVEGVEEANGSVKVTKVVGPGPTEPGEAEPSAGSNKDGTGARPEPQTRQDHEPEVAESTPGC